MFSFHGGLLWVDLINTEHLHDGQVQDAIQSGADWLDWFGQAGVQLMEEEQAILSNQAVLTARMTDWHNLRAHLRKLAETLAATGELPAEPFAFLNGRLAELRGAWQLQQNGGEYRAVFQTEDVSQRLEWQVLQSVLDFLTHSPWNRLKKCSNHQCIQYYFDTSKNNTRRWCRMESCGNREKARRHYRKKTNFLGNDGEV